MPQSNKAYAFDFDSNLVFTQDTIFLSKWDGISWQEVQVSQKEFDQLTVDGIQWKRLNDDYEDSLKNFLSPGNYKKALLDAIEHDMTWPSRLSFLEANESASPLAIITARGQSPQELKESHKDIIYTALTPIQRNNLVQNMQKRSGTTISPDQAIQLYLDNNLYIPVQSKEFFQESGTTIDTPTSVRKHIGLEMFVVHVASVFQTFSVWFSDDNIENVESMISFIKSDLLPKYPQVKFMVYNTNDAEHVKKIVM